MNPKKSEWILFRKGWKTKTHYIGGKEEEEKIKLLGVTLTKAITSKVMLLKLRPG